MWTESNSADVGIIGQFHDILGLFDNCLKNILIQNGRQDKVCLPLTTFYTELGVAPMFLLFYRQVRIQSFGRRVSDSLLGTKLYTCNPTHKLPC